jgi:peptide/nickel transport system ATP-binding protein/oligopeptide transport system ATP-binding protein
VNTGYALNANENAVSTDSAVNASISAVSADSAANIGSAVNAGSVVNAGSAVNTSESANAKTIDESGVLISVNKLCKQFKLNAGVFGEAKQVINAVNDLNFYIKKGETFGLVGESGCGKSTTGRLLIRLIEPTSGEIIYNNRNIAGYKGPQLRELRSEMQIIFQDPYSSLNPRMSCQGIIGEPMGIHTKMTRAERKEKIYELLNQVGLPKEYATRYPHEFSGGQRQRIGIARALAVNPSFVVCDEPVSALDVSVQSQVLNLLKSLQREMNLTYLFIAHGLHVVKYISDRIGVMYLGMIVELTDAEEIYRRPLHPYTTALISAIPDTNVARKKGRIILQGDVPNPTNLPGGCMFHTRCPECAQKCKTDKPEMKEASPGHFVACHLY